MRRQSPTETQTHIFTSINFLFKAAVIKLIHVVKRDNRTTGSIYDHISHLTTETEKYVNMNWAAFKKQDCDQRQQQETEISNYKNYVQTKSEKLKRIIEI